MKRKTLFQKVTGAAKSYLLSAALLLSFAGHSQDLNNGLKLHYTFESANGLEVPDVTGNGYDGLLSGGATIGLSNGKPSLILDATNTNWFDMGANTGTLIASLTDFSMSCYVWVNSTYGNLGNDGNMIATFSNSLDSYNSRNGYMFLQAKRSRYAITNDRYEAEIAVTTSSDVARGKWVQLTYTQSGTVGKLYVDGVLANTNNSVTLTPSSLGATQYNMLAKPSYSNDRYLSDSQISDFRIYDRPLSSDEVMMLNGYPTELISAYNALTLPDLSALESSITLPTTSGAIPVQWSSSQPAVISETGVVTRPDKFDAPVILTATLSKEVNGVTYTLTKTFNATVKASTVADDFIAYWNFKSDDITDNDGVVTVTDATDSKYVGTVKNEARIRTIGNAPNTYNVLDLGNGTGYFDMGTEIGKAVYSLKNYTVSAYFRVDDEYTELGSDGNFLYTFSNTENAKTEKTGYMIGILKETSHHVTSKDWESGDISIGKWANVEKNAWHHMAYSQVDNKGTLYIDGLMVAESESMTNLPSTTLPMVGRQGTLYNWLGRSCYATDVYLRKTLVYGFRLLQIGLTSNDLNEEFNGEPSVLDMLSNLNDAYSVNPDNILTELTTERDHLTLTGLDAVDQNLTLPARGELDNTIKISWKSSNPALVSNDGVITRPKFYAQTATLTASFSKNGQKTTKDFSVTVIPAPETVFVGDLLVKHDFATTLNDSVVVDASEQHLQAKLIKDAKIKTIGTTNKYKVLALSENDGYLDLGTDIGMLIYNLRDYTMSAYYRVDDSNTDIPNGKNGSFLWTFSNSTDPVNDATGYIFAGLNAQSYDISPKNWDSATGCISLSVGQKAPIGGWHHIAYTQSGTTGTLYVDGDSVVSRDVANLPAEMLKRSGRLGTLYNFIGRSCYKGDADLHNSMVYDFRLYRKALTDTEIQTSVYDVKNTISALNAAFTEGTGLNQTSDSKYIIIGSKGQIEIKGLTGAEKVRVTDIAGYDLINSNKPIITLKAGVYIVKIGNVVKKVIVK